MLNELLVTDIVKNFPFEPTAEQLSVIEAVSKFVISTNQRRLFVLRGYAGTGKTTLVGALVKTLVQHRKKVVLMAPTGRAAKVFSLYSEMATQTIHKRIYRQKSISEQYEFVLNVNTMKDTLFFVDEASMISNGGYDESIFGSGRLLDDLIQFVYSGKGCALFLIGDTAQLPPIGQYLSPALSTDALTGYGLNVEEMDMVQVMRHIEQSGILYNATALREVISPAVMSKFTESSVFNFKFRLKGFSDIMSINGEDLIEEIGGCYSRDGIEESVVVCRSNKRAIRYNNGIRATILGREDEINGGDHVMIVKNNYFWIEKLEEELKQSGSDDQLPFSFIANGDTAIVKRVRKKRELHGFHFMDALLEFPDYGDFEIETILLTDALFSEAPALTKEENEKLFFSFMKDYVDTPRKRDRFRKIREDKHFNAFQVKFAYAVTCHKAQGGQWRNVFIDQGYITQQTQNAEYYRWLYTALSRATKRVYLVNWPEIQITR
ncbi:MAG TPA: AAA family ATPase [Bacteroidaceae bacterium]|nr:AAA family ATPase [Bacteroidaceae bacterium]